MTELYGKVNYLTLRMKLNLCQNLQYSKNIFDQKCNKKVHDKGAFTNYVCTQGWVGSQKNMQSTTQKVQTSGVLGQKMPTNANVIC